VINVKDCYEAASNACIKQVIKHIPTLETSKILRLGGRRASPQVRIVHNLSTEISTTYPDLPVNNIHAHCSIIQDDYIYCIGGAVERDKKMQVLNNVWRFDLKNSSTGWKEVASMNKKRYRMGAALHGDVIIVAGGVNENNDLKSSVEIYQTSSNEWKTITSLNQKRNGHALVSCGGCLYALGGHDGKHALSSVKRLDFLNGRWKNIESMQTPRIWISAVNCGGVIYAIGGIFKHTDISTTLKTVERYDSATNKWKYVSDMNVKRRTHSACVLHNKIYVVGGLNESSCAIKEIECYDPTCDTWSIVGNVTEKLFHHTIVAV